MEIYLIISITIFLLISLIIASGVKRGEVEVEDNDSTAVLAVSFLWPLFIAVLLIDLVFDVDFTKYNL